jgi:hypothetical protein
VATSYRSVCCLDCGITYAPDEMKSHVTGQSHAARRLKLNNELYRCAIEECNVLSALPPPPVNEDIPPLAGLTIQDGWWCNVSRVCTETESSMKRHIQPACKRLHSDQQNCYQSGPVQRFNARQQSTWFRVQTATQRVVPIADADGKFLADARRLIQKGYVDPDTIDNCHNVCAWLRQSRWHLHTKDSDLNQIQALVSLPTEEEFRILDSAIEQYIKHAESLTKLAHPAILKRLKTEDSSKYALCFTLTSHT